VGHYNFPLSCVPDFAIIAAACFPKLNQSTSLAFAARRWRVLTGVGVTSSVLAYDAQNTARNAGRAPFKPFDLELSDGRTLTVATPDHLFFMPNSKEFHVVLPDGGFRFVDAAQVVSTGRGTARAKAH
jgi:hypothetical protein